MAVPASTGPITSPTADLAGSIGESSPLAASMVITVSEAATSSATTTREERLRSRPKPGRPPSWLIGLPSEGPL